VIAKLLSIESIIYELDQANHMLYELIKLLENYTIYVMFNFILTGCQVIVIYEEMNMQTNLLK
jgi:hypothetical protein